MPRDPFLPLTRDEQKFVFHYLREGAVPEVAYIAERKCRLKKGTGALMLKRKHVALEIQRRKASVELEENLLIARDKAKLAEERDAADKVTMEKIERALDGVLKLNPETHGSVVLSAVSLGLVYQGTIRTGRAERVIPIDPTKSGKADAELPGFYSSIFAEMQATEQQKADAVGAAPLMPDTARTHTATPAEAVAEALKPLAPPAPVRKPTPQKTEVPADSKAVTIT